MELDDDTISSYNITLNDDPYDTITKTVTFKKGMLLKRSIDNNICLGIEYVKNQFLDSYFMILSNNKVEYINENLIKIIFDKDSACLSKVFNTK